MVYTVQSEIKTIQDCHIPLLLAVLISKTITGPLKCSFGTALSGLYSEVNRDLLHVPVGEVTLCQVKQGPDQQRVQTAFPC